MYRLAGDVVARVDALGSDMALLAVYRRCSCQWCVAGSVCGREAVYGRRYLCDADDGVLQVTERLFGLLQLAAYALPVLLLSVPCPSSVSDVCAPREAA
jgi:hypothetical protein